MGASSYIHFHFVQRIEGHIRAPFDKGAGGLGMTWLMPYCVFLPRQETGITPTQRWQLRRGERLSTSQLIRSCGDEKTQLPDPR